MKYLISSFLIPLLLSCQSGEARSFERLLDSTEQKSLRILISDGQEKKRLEALVRNRPDIALSIGKQQTTELAGLIHEIEKADVSGVQNADMLKKNILDYYKGLLQLKNLDLAEAELMVISLGKDTAIARKATINISNLPAKRLQVYKGISESDLAIQKARKKFMDSNPRR
ncbi:hypothetical protein ODZ84_22595 [Chryseobacterium fluminis]|uniref:hypothetical protein n=1 Tax=Chryseobacterium fluminis TaxID=2983606 RepID=UPI0022552071|nr:hypothetical protein [Chryseobacterium sp. MMS21-Ot14]UZT97922.1 hypothetical protein ODZ84_22595 [Chryseobacterium sp. MMS21-Ot14]